MYYKLGHFSFPFIIVVSLIKETRGVDIVKPARAITPRKRSEKERHFLMMTMRAVGARVYGHHESVAFVSHTADDYSLDWKQKKTSGFYTFQHIYFSHLATTAPYHWESSASSLKGKKDKNTHLYIFFMQWWTHRQALFSFLFRSSLEAQSYKERERKVPDLILFTYWIFPFCCCSCCCDRNGSFRKRSWLKRRGERGRIK